jgi:hypothetical protein
MKRKKARKRTPEEQARYDETTRLLEERIAYYDAKVKARQEAERHAAS